MAGGPRGLGGLPALDRREYHGVALEDATSARRRRSALVATSDGRQSGFDPHGQIFMISFPHVVAGVRACTCPGPGERTWVYAPGQSVRTEASRPRGHHR